jgi:hypothetical protein
MANAADNKLKGSTLKVVRGRKVPVGTVGVCIWNGEGKKAAWGRRVGIKDSDGEVHWTAEKNCEVVSQGQRSQQQGLFSKASQGNKETTLIWIERLTDGIAVVAFDATGNKLIHDHRFDVGADEQATKLADKVRESGKDWTELAKGEHWTTALSVTLAATKAA